MTMTDQEILDALVWAVEAIEEDRKTDAYRYVTQVRDEYETRQEMANEAIQEAFYADNEASDEASGEDLGFFHGEDR